MRNHGWELPYHPLQTVAVAVFSGISLSFFVFFIPFVGSNVLKFHVYAIFSPVVLAVFVLYVRCAGSDPADPGVHDSKRVARAKQQAVLKSMDFTVDTGLEHSQPSVCARLLSLPFACCINSDPIKYKMGEQLLYCSICEAKISMNSKHCKACDKCVHEFDHHCRWLNNCVGKRNYKTFVSLMVACLLLLIIVWCTGIGVLVRCFTQKATFEKEISHRLGRSFPRVPYIIVVVFMSLLAMLATIPLCQLFIFHLILIHKGMTTYDYILATREHGVLTEGDGFNSLTSSPASSISTEISGYSSTGALALQTGVFCTPPRMFVEHEQKVLDMESSGKTSKAKPAHPKKVSVGINPWKLARLNAAEAVKVAAQAREASTIIRPIITEPPQIEDSSFESSRNVSGEIALTRKHAALVGKEKWPSPQLQAARCSSPSRLSGEMRASYPGSSCPGSSSYQSCSQAASPETFRGQEPAGSESLLLPESTSNDGEKASAATLHKGYLDTSVFTPIEKVAVWEDGTQECVNPLAPSPGSRAPSSGSRASRGRRESRAEANILRHVSKEWPELRDRLSDSPDGSFFSPFSAELHDSKSGAEARQSSRPPTEALQVSSTKTNFTKVGKQSITKLAGARD